MATDKPTPLDKLYAYMRALVRTDDEIPAKVPCKPEILALRACVKVEEKAEKPCLLDHVELLLCQAQHRVDINAKVRESIGIAKYSDYVKHMETEHGKEKAAEIIAEPAEKVKDIEAYKTFLQVEVAGAHPKGNKPKRDWTEVDKKRLELGEHAYSQHVMVVAQEFGFDNADKLLGLKADTNWVNQRLEHFQKVLANTNELSAEELLEAKSAFAKLFVEKMP